MGKLAKPVSSTPLPLLPRSKRVVAQRIYEEQARARKQSEDTHTTQPHGTQAPLLPSNTSVTDASSSKPIDNIVAQQVEITCLPPPLNVPSAVATTNAHLIAPCKSEVTSELTPRYKEPTCKWQGACLDATEKESDKVTNAVPLAKRKYRKLAQMQSI